MHRTQLIELLNNYQSIYAEEIEFKAKMLDFIKTNPDCFERSLQQGHITASCWLTNENSTQALLLHHMKLDRWFQLGGHCDGDSNVLAVALKEAQEESGILNIVPTDLQIFDIDIHAIPANSKEQAHDHYDVRFLLKVVGDQTVISNRESKALKWISTDIQELPTQLPSVVRMFKKWIDRNHSKNVVR